MVELIFDMIFHDIQYCAVFADGVIQSEGTSGP